MGLTITQVDAFTDTPFGSNPAAVCVLPEPGDARWMQQVAREMNLAETAFLHRQEDGFSLRWFTPRWRARTSSGKKGICGQRSRRAFTCAAAC